MYKLIIGNVRISVTGDKIPREQAIETAKQAISVAHKQGKLLSHIEIDTNGEELITHTTEKTGYKAARKTIKQSMLDGIGAAVKEKLYPTEAFAVKNLWFDTDTGQEWRGETVNLTRDEIFQQFNAWLETL